MPGRRILFIANVVPYPPHGGVQQRVFQLLRRVARRHSVTLGCHVRCREELEGAEWLNRNGIRTITGRLTDGNWRHIAPAVGAALRGRPPETVQYLSPVLESLLRREEFDIVHVEESLLAPYARCISGHRRTRTVLTFIDVRFIQARRLAQIEHGRWRRTWRNANARFMRRYEPRIARSFDRVIAVSEADRKLLLDAAPDLKIDVIANGVDTDALQMLPETEGPPAVVFVGTLNYQPCIDAARWLVRGILPKVRERIPDLEAWIVGRNATPEVEALAGERVFVVGPVPDVGPYYRRAAAAVVPVRAGSGSRLKILEAMALGRPVVSTTLGAEGLKVRNEEHILLADDEDQFARNMTHVIMNESFRRPLLRSARRYVEELHSWDTIADALLGIYDELAVDGARR